MRTSLLVAALALPCAAQDSQPDPEQTGRLLFEAFTRADEPGAGKQLAVLRTIDSARAVDAIEGCYRRSLQLMSDVAKEEKKLLRELEDKKGQAAEEMRIKYLLNQVRVRLYMCDDWIPRLCVAMHGLKSEPSVRALVSRATAGHDWYFRAHAVTALARADSARDALVEQLGRESEAGVKVAILDALAPRLKADANLQHRCVELVSDPHWQVQVAALRGLRGGAPKTCVPHLISLMKTAGGRIRHEINEVLKIVTGIDKHEHEAWKAWWEEHGAEFLDGSFVPKVSERAEQKGQSTFYGMPIRSTHLMLMIDLSTSMTEKATWRPDVDAEPFTGSTRMDVAKYELKRLIRQIPSGTRLNICCFHHGFFFYEDRTVPLDEPRRRKMCAWVDALKMGFATSTWDALRAVFEHAGGGWNAKLRQDGLDSVYLLTDGEPMGRASEHRIFLEKALELNRFKKVAINTIAIEPAPNPRGFLKSLAAQNGGEFLER